MNIYTNSYRNLLRILGILDLYCQRQVFCNIGLSLVYLNKQIEISLQILFSNLKSMLNPLHNAIAKLIKLNILL